MNRTRLNHDPSLKAQIGLAALKIDKPRAELAD